MPPSSEALVIPQSKNGKLVPVSSFAKASSALIRSTCKSDVSEEWTKVDDSKIAKLRGILQSLQEENQSTQLLKKESEDKEAQRALQATRASVETRLAACKEKEAFFRKRQDELRKHVMENQKSMQELESTIEKGDKKLKDEEVQIDRLDAEIIALEEELAAKVKAKEAELKRIAKTARYKNFLEEVAQEFSEDFDGDVEVLMHRHATLEAGSQELHQANEELTARLDRLRDESMRVQKKLQNEHGMIGIQLHECQADLDHQVALSQELEQQLNRSLEEKELKESQVGVIQMAIEQLFTRTVSSCRLEQRRKAMLDAIDVKYAPLRGDKSDVRLEEMFKQILERIEDLKDMFEKAQDQLKKETKKEENAVIEEVDVMERIKFVTQRGETVQDAGSEASHSQANSLAAGSSTLVRTSPGPGGSTSPSPRSNSRNDGRSDTFLTEK